MPLTPEANLSNALVFRSNGALAANSRCDVLDELLSLDVVHAVNTGDTVTEYPVSPCCSLCSSMIFFPYPTERTRPVSARPDSSWTPRILCSRMEVTSVGEALASAA